MIVFVSVLFAYRCFLYVGIIKNKQGLYDKYNHLFLDKNNQYDVLFAGSSRAEMHFNPQIFDSITRLKSYNMGISGATPKVSLALLKTYYKQSKIPKFLVLNIDYFALQNDSDIVADFSRFFPYLQNKNLHNELAKIDKRFTSFYYNPLHSLPYTQVGFLSTALHGYLNISGKYDTLMYKGFRILEPDTTFHEVKKSFACNYISVKNRLYIDSLINFTKEQKINLILLTAPIFETEPVDIIVKQKLKHQLRTLTLNRNIFYLDFSDDREFKHKKLFTDNLHLNKEGADLFSVKFSKLFNNIKPDFALDNK